MEYTTHSYFLLQLVLTAHSIGDGLCLDLEVRLVGPSGPSQYRGRLEVRRNESEPWGTVCNDHWNSRASSVVCYQLDLGGGKEICDHDKTTSGAIYPEGIIWCTGEESNLGQCRAGPRAVDECSHSAPVGVACEPLQDVEVRLVGGSSAKEGRVELRRASEESWGTVCDDGWDYRDATVVCRQLGLGTTGHAKVKGFYGQGSGPIYLDNVKCRGTEFNLGHCTGPPWSSSNCQHSEDAGVLCTGEDLTTPEIDSEKTGVLRNLSRADVNEENLPEIVNTTKSVLRENTTTSALHVILVANILEIATRQSNIPKETATDILEIVEIVAGLNKTVLEQANTADNARNRVLQVVESLGDRVSLGDSASARIETNDIVLQVWNLTTVSDSHVLGLELELDSGEVTEVTGGQSLVEEKYNNTDTAIMLPGKTFRSIVQKYPGRDIRISASIFTNTSLFRSSASIATDADSRHRHATLNSKVIALRITVDGQPITNLSAFGDGSVTTVFTPVQSLPKDQAIQRERSRCVFWDFALQDGKGAWSEEGCYQSDTVQEKVVCDCDHLTNFAVLLDPYGQETRIAQVHDSALSLISVVGLGLSIAGLSVTVVSFIVIKKLHSSHPQQTLFNMALALLLSWVTFLAGFSRVHGHVSCVMVAALLHYLILVSFMWMVIEGILQYLLLVKVMVGTFSRYMLKTALPAWGLPLIPVIIILSIDVNLYNGWEHYCWMSRTPFYYAFLAPIVIMVSANIVLYVLVVVSICRRRDMSHGGTSYNVISIRASIGCFIVLGLSWGFAFFAIEDARLVFQYLFTCTTAFQGVIIFVIFTARDPAVRQFWLGLICRRKHNASRGSLTPRIQSAPGGPVTKETSFNRTK